ncbi:MAG TPA: OB-fold domain-containing protein [Chloroflexota bacterium]
MNPLVRPEPRKNVYEAPFWEFVQQHELRLQRCSECNTYRYPPGPACFRCLSEDSKWVPLSGSGRLLSWVVFHRQYFPELPIPYYVAAVETKEGPILIANLLNLGERQPRLDMPVRVVYETTATSDGGTWEIFQWQPA